MALATSQGSDLPLFLRPLDGNSSDQVSLLAAVEALQGQPRARNLGHGTRGTGKSAANADVVARVGRRAVALVALPGRVATRAGAMGHRE